MIRRRSFPIALPAILLLAMIVRVRGIESQSIWYDEACSIRIARMPLRDVLTGVAITENTPPLHYFVLWGWIRLFGDSVMSVRMPSVLAGVLSVWALYAMSRRYFGATVAMLAAAMLASAPYLIYYAQEARAYALLVCLGLTSCVCLLRWIERPTRARAIVYVLVSTAVLYTHLYGAMILLAHPIVFLATAGRSNKVWKTWLVLAIAIVVLFAPYVSTMLSWRGRAQYFWIHHNSFDDVGDALWKYTGSRLAACVFAALCVVALVRGRRHPGVIALTALFTCSIVVPIVVSMMTEALFIPRYGLVAAPALFAVAAYGATQIGRSGSTSMIVSSLALALIAFGDAPPLRPDYRPIVRYIEAHAYRGDIITIRPKDQTILFDAIVRRRDIDRRGFANTLPITLPLDQNAGRVFLISDGPKWIEAIARSDAKIKSHKQFGDYVVMELEVERSASP